jgi:peroxiredoxin 2/4
MKKLVAIILIASAYSPCMRVYGQSLVSIKAPTFKAKAVEQGEIKDISLDMYKGKNKILIFYPADFTFICPTELFAFQEKIDEFIKRNTVLIAASVDSLKKHQDWLNTPRDQGGIQGITYPIVSDESRAITKSFNAFDGKENKALRAVFIIDKDNIIRAMAIYDMSIGRNIDEVLRVLDAALFTQEHGQVCPANWDKNKEALTPTKEGLEEYIKHTEYKNVNKKGETYE